MSNLNKQFGNNHGDLRGQSAGEYYPFDIVAVGKPACLDWIIVDLRKDVDEQIAAAKAVPRHDHNCGLYATCHVAEAYLKGKLKSGELRKGGA